MDRESCRKVRSNIFCASQHCIYVLPMCAVCTHRMDIEWRVCQSREATGEVTPCHIKQCILEEDPWLKLACQVANRCLLLLIPTLSLQCGLKDGSLCAWLLHHHSWPVPNLSKNIVLNGSSLQDVFQNIRLAVRHTVQWSNLTTQETLKILLLLREHQGVKG